jgi:translation initiation factor IF-3
VPRGRHPTGARALWLPHEPPERADPEENRTIRPDDRSLPAPAAGPRINERIRIREVRLIDHEGKQVGVVPTEQALQMAQEANLDLVEVAPNVRPPVCKIMDFGKYKYEQNKKAHESKVKQHKTKLKTVRLRPKTDPHMLEIRVAMARDFLTRGDKVQIMIMFRGREMAHQDQGIAHCTEVAKRLEDVAKVEQSPRTEGKRMVMLLTHK